MRYDELPISIVVLEDQSDHSLSRIAATHYSKLRMYRTNESYTAKTLINKHKPFLAIIDIDTVKDKAPEFVESLTICSPRTTCIIASLFVDGIKIFQTLKAGAKGYLQKGISDEQHIKQIQDIIKGRPMLAPSIAYLLLNYLHKRPDFDYQETLTRRENIILKLIAEGKKRMEISSELNISMNTVATHVKSIYQKLDIGNQAEATLAAVRLGLVKIPTSQMHANY